MAMILDLFLLVVSLILKVIDIVIMTVSMIKKMFGESTITDMLEVTMELLMSS